MKWTTLQGKTLYSRKGEKNETDYKRYYDEMREYDEID